VRSIGHLNFSQYKTNKMNSKIIDSIIEDLESREKKGLETYGTTVDRNDLTQEEWMQHLYEELLDSAVYLKKLIHMNTSIKSEVNRLQDVLDQLKKSV
jgi:hypothetical protein